MAATFYAIKREATGFYRIKRKIVFDYNMEQRPLLACYPRAISTYPAIKEFHIILRGAGHRKTGQLVNPTKLLKEHLKCEYPIPA